MPFNVGEEELGKQQTRRPYFSKTYITSANIAAGANSTERFISEEEEWQFAPFDTILIVNADSVDLAINMDGNPDNYIPVRAGVTLAATEQNFRNFTIKNLDGSDAHTAGKVRIVVQRTYKPQSGKISS